MADPISIDIDISQMDAQIKSLTLELIGIEKIPSALKRELQDALLDIVLTEGIPATGASGVNQVVMIARIGPNGMERFRAAARAFKLNRVGHDPSKKEIIINA